jgi:uncharacterized membrane protein required for colicin V production
MILSLLVLILVGVIAFFHYTQGFFSATLSAIICVLAAVMAVSYDEPLVDALLKGKMADQAHACMLIVIFAGVYCLLRFAFDAMVPGNVRFPVLVDKIGAGVMGLIAGLFAGGIFAIAAQMLPFGPTVGMFSRYELSKPRDVVVPTGGRSIDAQVIDEVKADRIDPTTPQNKLIIPADDLVIAMTQKLSDNGSLAGDYLGELSAARLGIQVGAKMTAYNFPGQQTLTVAGVFTAPALPEIDEEVPTIRGARDPALPPVVKSDPTQMILIIRAKFSASAADDGDRKFRFSPASVRLKAGPPGNEKDYHPIGTLEGTNLIYNDKPDDFLIADAGKGADLVFLVPPEDVCPEAADPKAKDLKIAPGTFLEVKRYAREDLSGKPIAPISDLAADPSIELLRKPAAAASAKKAPGSP